MSGYEGRRWCSVCCKWESDAVFFAARAKDFTGPSTKWRKRLVKGAKLREKADKLLSRANKIDRKDLHGERHPKDSAEYTAKSK